MRAATVSASHGAVRGLALLLAAAVALTVVFLWVGRPRVTAAPPDRRRVPPAAALEPSSAGSPTVAPTSAAAVVVHVAGAVRRPGLVELPGGSRVDDAVEAAGGPTAKADLASVNLARPLVDGEQIVVVRRGGPGPPGAAGGPPAAGTSGSSPSGTAAPGAVVDLNSATLDQLDTLPGVGPVLAQRILDWRTAHSRFTSVDELTEVSGIGEKTLADLRPLVQV